MSPSFYFYVSQAIKDSFERDKLTLRQAIVAFPAHAGETAHLMQTYLWMCDLGMNCRLVSSMPDEGVIVCHRKSLPEEIRPTAKQYFVYSKGDWDVHYFAQLHVLQNPYDMRALDEQLWQTAFIHCYPQPDLVARDTCRGDQFQSIAFVGDLDNLASQLQAESFAQWVKSQGMCFQLKQHGEWHDYRSVDAVLAVRRILPINAVDVSDIEIQKSFIEKPASKLINSWLAGVPAILGVESCYRHFRQSDYDYLEVGSLRDIKDAIERLSGNVELRHNMRMQAAKRAQFVSAEAIALQWRNLLEEVYLKHFPAWQVLLEKERWAFLECRAQVRENYMARKRSLEESSGEKLLMSYPV